MVCAPPPLPLLLAMMLSPLDVPYYNELHWGASQSRALLACFRSHAVTCAARWVVSGTWTAGGGVSGAAVNSLTYIISFISVMFVVGKYFHSPLSLLG